MRPDPENCKTLASESIDIDELRGYVNILADEATRLNQVIEVSVERSNQLTEENTKLKKQIDEQIDMLNQDKLIDECGCSDCSCGFGGGSI